MSARSATSHAPGARLSALRAVNSLGALSGLSGVGVLSGLSGLGGTGGRRAPREHRTGAALRAYLAAQPASSSKRIVRDDAGAPLRLMATRAGGDCGFEAVSWALAVARGHGPDAREVRAAVHAHVAAERAAYARACGAGDRHVDHFLGSVLRPGIRGHWLGQTWGALEIVAVARALRVTVCIYAWDAARQAVRAYFEEPAGQDVVRLLFTGHAERGHFDVLVEERPRKGWARLWRKRVGKKVAMCEMERGVL